MRANSVILYTAIFVLTNMPPDTTQRSPLYIPEDATLNFTQLGTKLGVLVQEHDVVTEDGYILKLFHIPGDKDKTVLLMHGILDTADTFIISGKGSMMAALTSAGYDVWVGNHRGNPYSRRHTELDPDTEDSYWDFSFHEIGVYDLPALIDFILEKNDVKQLSAIGHSLGNTIFYVLGSVRPEYNDKIKVMIALGPVCFLNLENFQFPINTLVEAVPYVNEILTALTQEEILGPRSFLTYLRNTVCREKVLGYKLCAEALFFQLAGEDKHEFGPDEYYPLIGHYPTGSSRKNLLHLMQVAKARHFRQYDYGLTRNVKSYNASSPPAYNLKYVTMKTALLVGRNDKLTPLDNVQILRKLLPNLVKFQIMEPPKFNHIDFLWGKNMHKYLFPHVMKILEVHS